MSASRSIRAGAGGAAAAASRFDVVLYGATGFTGRLVAAHLASRARAAGVRWAMAGRDAGKLASLAAELGAGAGAVIVTSDPAVVARSGRVILTTVGPYLAYGEPLIAACIAEGAEAYADLTGETPWAALMISAYDDAAKRAGCTLIHMSGFDSIPGDGGAWLLADAARSRLGAGVRRVRAFFRGTGGVSGGTLASGLGVMQRPSLAAMQRDPLLLFPAGAVGAAGTGTPRTHVVAVPDALPPFYVAAFDATAVPFVMAPINTRVVRRSAGLLAAHSARLAGCAHALAPLPAGAAVAPSAAATRTYSPGAAFAYSEYMLVGRGYVRSYLAGVLVWLGFGLVQLLLALPGAARVVAALVPAPGTGPSAAQRARSRWALTLVGEADDAAASTVVVRASGTCGGYADTAEMLGEVGILLATERAALPATAIGGGFLTPAVALGRRLPQVLNAHTHVRMEVLYAGPSPAPAAAFALPDKLRSSN